MSRTPKHTFWVADGIRFGRVATFPTAVSFLARIYQVTREEDEENAFYEDWKAEHPFPSFALSEERRVRRAWYCWRFFDGGGLYLDSAQPNTRGAFELWEWE